MTFTTQKIFIEVSFFMAFIDRVNFNHLQAAAILEHLAKHNFQLYTSSLVVTQTFGYLEKELGATVADEFLQAILESQIQILYPDQTDFLTAFRLLKNSVSRVVSLTEILNTTLMNKHHLYTVLTFNPWHNLLSTKISPLINNKEDLIK